MKNYLDGFYEVIHKNDLKRRKMFSLLLVLSLFVTSGVVWGLRGTGITMVNEPLCSIEEHIHSDACYNTVLVCGLEENESHTHTEACYEQQLICGIEEHIHVPQCYLEATPEGYKTLENEPVRFVEMPSASIAETTEPTETTVAADVTTETNAAAEDTTETETTAQTSETTEISDTEPESRALPRVLAAAKPPVLPAPPSPTGYVDTWDTRSDGITINLFDYGGDSLEYTSNWYNNPTYEGINKGRSMADDILFLSYGTPFGHKNNGSEPNSWKKNAYTGDYFVNPNIPGNKAMQGIVNKQLGTDGYPTISGSNHSLAYLFNLNEYGTEADTKEIFSDVNHLLKKTDNTYHFNSDEWYAYYDKNQGNGGDFEVLNGTFQVGNSGGSNDGSQSDINVGFFPFDAYDESHKEVEAKNSWDKRGDKNPPYCYNHHFGMTMEAEFQIPKNTSEDIVFKYSGDDDMWVFIDGILALDVGGIHEPVYGEINFTTGATKVQDNFENGSPKYLTDNLSNVFAAQGKTWDPYAEHEIKIFYLERGASFSNLMMEFNIPVAKSVFVSKEVDDGSALDPSYKAESFDYILYGETGVGTGQYLPLTEYEYFINDSTTAKYTAADGTFSLTSGETAMFRGLDSALRYYVVEKKSSLDSDIFSSVTLNGTTRAIDDNLTDDVWKTQVQKLSDNNVFDFTNKVREEQTDLDVEKAWVDNLKSHSNMKAQFRIQREDEEGNVDYVVIDGKRTYTLKEANNWTMHFDDLITRYGDHTYQYEIIEVNVPNGYTPSYTSSTQADGSLKTTVTNTDSSKVEIHVEKQWFDTDGNVMDTPPQDIKVQLYRDDTPYTLPSKTKLTVKTTNSDGDQTNIWESNDVYVGGSAEFTVSSAEPRDILSITANNCTVNQYGSVFEASNIQNGATVTIQYDELTGIILHHTFDNGSDGWTVRGNGNLSTLSDSTPFYNKSLRITGRNASWHGAEFRLNNLDIDRSKPYSFFVAIREEGSNDVKLSLRYHVSNNSSEQYTTIAQTGLSSWSWTTLSNTSYSFPSNIDWNQDVCVYVETTGGTANLHIDEFMIAQAGTTVTADVGSGITSPTDSLGITTHEFELDPDTCVAELIMGTTLTNQPVGDPVTLTSGEGLKYVWNTAALGESANHKYTYYAKEITPVFGYVTTITGNNISANTKDSPILIKNECNSYELPSTGGEGTRKFYIFGAFLLLTSLLCGCLIHKRERRSKMM
ncbi:MAG: fibro-slime domain-containing protein [Oscillospiraceae bacterium]|nr:fibro-slime domain-containing protein [Oscillospiraceae bacterium]